jgi:integrase
MTTTDGVVQGAEAPTRRRRRRGEGGLYRRPGTVYWWMAVPYRGRMLRETTGETDKKKAREKLKAKRDEVGAARGGYTTLVGPEHRAKTVKALLDALVQDFELRKVRSLKSINSQIKSVENAFGHRKVVELSEDAVNRYVTDRLKAGHAHSSINHSLQFLGQAIRPFLTKHRLPVPEIHRLPEDNVREGFYSRGDVETLIAALPEDLRDFTRWGLLTGWRKSEIASLRWADVDREGGSLRLSWRRSKNKQARTMALVGDLATIIERRSAARTITTKQGATLISPLVFHRGEGHGKHQGEAAPVLDFDKAFKSACEAAGIPYGRKAGRTFHCFRRTAARNLRNAGVPENVCMAITGHRTRAMFDRYSIVNENDTAEAMSKLQAHVSAQPVESNVVALKRASKA